MESETAKISIETLTICFFIPAYRGWGRR